MAWSLKDKLATLDLARREKVASEAERLHAEYLTLQEMRKAKKLTQLQPAETLGVEQSTVTKYERQSDLLLSTLTSYVRAMGGEIKLMVKSPGKAPVALEGLGETDEVRRSSRLADPTYRPLR